MHPGAQFGPYRVESLLGAGGMGEVYLAVDTRLGRKVALKVLNRELSADESLRKRFEREAKLISSLNHPNICALYDLGRDDGVDFLVMEYLEGETLAQKISRGPLPLEQIVQIGVDIANALERAHRQGIVHRDLKPGNVMLTKSGVKLLDFGIAKSAADSIAPNAATAPLTQEGTIVGTVHYMAPEQIEGKAADARSDLFALGAILYEMATGRVAFAGTSGAGVIAAVLERDPPPLDSPLERVVRACLAKDPDARIQTAHDVALALKWIGEWPSAAPAAAAATRAPWPWIVAAIAALIAAAALYVAAHRPPPPFALSIAPPPGSTLIESTIAPDGSVVAFAAAGSDGRQALWLRRLDDPSPKLLAKTSRVDKVVIFWSPDSKWIGYTDNSRLMRVRADGGEPEKIADGIAGPSVMNSTAAWNGDGTILFAPRFGAGIVRVEAFGSGKTSAVTTPDPKRGELVHLDPIFLPDGKHYLYLAYVAGGERNRIYGNALDGGVPRLITTADSLVGYAKPYLVFVRQGALYAQRFDADRMELRGDARRVVDDITFREPDAFVFASLSPGGVLAYVPYQPSPVVFNVYNRAGALVKTLWTAPDLWHDFEIAGVRVSPRGKMLLVAGNDPAKGGSDAITFDVARGIATRITGGPSTNRNAVWSPDEQSVAFSSDRAGFYDVFVKAADPAAPERLVWNNRFDKHVADWSRDGKTLLVVVDDPRTNFDIWVLPLTGEKPWPLVQSDGVDSQAQFSPDGKWVAYTSDQSGRTEVYVRGFPSGRAVQVSTAGGRVPTWSSDGKEILFSTAAGDVMLAAIRLNGQTLEPGLPQKLFSVTDIAEAPRFLPDGNIVVGEQPAKPAALIDVTTAWRAKAP